MCIRDSVKSIAQFLGVHLGVDETPHASYGKGDVTTAEAFHSFREARSVTWQARRRALARLKLRAARAPCAATGSAHSLGAGAAAAFSPPPVYELLNRHGCNARGVLGAAGRTVGPCRPSPSRPRA